MTRANVLITIDSNSRDIEFCVLEGLRLDPRVHFTFKNGSWEGEFADFPIGNDSDLDLLIIVRGNTNTSSNMSVLINNTEMGPFQLFKPFNRNGYGQFNEAISI